MPLPGYLPATRSGIDWLLDPEHPRMRDLGGELRRRAPDTPVDVDALLEDVALLPRLVRERHAFAVLGRCAPDAVDAVIDDWRHRLSAERPDTWGAAVGDVVPALREALQDNHLMVGSDTTTRALRPRMHPDPGPAWESDLVADEAGAVGVVRIRTLAEEGGAGAALLEGSADQQPWRADRVVVDLRGNGGGDDSFVRRWSAPFVREDVATPVGRRLSVGELPVNVWNYIAYLQLRHPDEPPPAALLPLRHAPSPTDVLTVHDVVDEIAAGSEPWSGRMLVIVDGGTASSGESAAWLLRACVGARVIGGRTMGLFESGDLCPYLLPHAGLLVMLPTQWVQVPEPVEFVGLRPDVEVDVTLPVADVVARFDELWEAASLSGGASRRSTG